MNEEKTSCHGQQFQIRPGTKNSKFASSELLAIFNKYKDNGLYLLVDRTDQGRMWVGGCGAPFPNVKHRIDRLSLEEVGVLLEDLAICKRQSYSYLVRDMVSKKGTVKMLERYVASDGGEEAWDEFLTSYYSMIEDNPYTSSSRNQNDYPYLKSLDFRDYFKKILPAKKNQERAQRKREKERKVVEDNHRKFVASTEVITCGRGGPDREDLQSFFTKSGVLSYSKLDHTPFIVFDKESSDKVRVHICSKVGDVFEFSPEIRVMAQWRGEWRSDFFHMSVLDIAQACVKHDRSMWLDEAQRYLLKHMQEAAG